MSEPLNGEALGAVGVGAGTQPVEPATSGPSALGVVVAPTGNEEVDALIERLGDADALPTQSHIEVYEDVHRGLRDALTALDDNRS
ncbi:hypothetical protein [Actinacidiphila oryziradicis]|jgi:hypothetical protein|uniref:Uncharacterized protein n=1 Tax=Actinacidiphila oryziradicis TaxID=2571141 RepID=A0A4U0SLA4_9ACTN|nr:hypothetical protein [Actinacidiphila oryziradicis]MCW2873110.1 hypothetical protein [Actinacidiphila oryziradicis]MCW2873119.1 hypothetical protein [Actinacidiphila oryziradicis]TKA08987.1 hypothetical protein FCI23_24490 [Actinacidiphila oryziradicis]